MVIRWYVLTANCLAIAENNSEKFLVKLKTWLEFAAIEIEANKQ
ncbi:hypothetical protein [Chroococcidiopsis sp.]